MVVCCRCWDVAIERRMGQGRSFFFPAPLVDLYVRMLQNGPCKPCAAEGRRLFSQGLFPLKLGCYGLESSGERRRVGPTWRAVVGVSGSSDSVTQHRIASPPCAPAIMTLPKSSFPALASVQCVVRACVSIMPLPDDSSLSLHLAFPHGLRPLGLQACKCSAPCLPLTTRCGCGGFCPVDFDSL